MPFGQIVPARQAEAITPADSTLQHQYRAFYVGTAGDVKVITKGGDTVTFVGCVAGQIYDIEITQVLSTGTAASDIVGLN